MTSRLIYRTAFQKARKIGPDGLADELGIPGAVRPKIAAKYSLRYRTVAHRIAAREGVMNGFLAHDGIDDGDAT